MPLSNQWLINPSTPQKPNLQSLVHVHTDTWYGFRIVGDNLDEDVKPQFMRLDRPKRSLHYACCTRLINLSDVTDKIPISTAKTVAKMDLILNFVILFTVI